MASHRLGEAVLGDVRWLSTDMLRAIAKDLPMKVYRMTPGKRNLSNDGSLSGFPLTIPTAATIASMVKNRRTFTPFVQEEGDRFLASFAWLVEAEIGKDGKARRGHPAEPHPPPLSETGMPDLPDGESYDDPKDAAEVKPKDDAVTEPGVTEH